MYAYDVENTGPLKKVAEVAQKSIVRFHRYRITTSTCVYILRHESKPSSLAAIMARKTLEDNLLSLAGIPIANTQFSAGTFERQLERPRKPLKHRYSPYNLAQASRFSSGREAF